MLLPHTQLPDGTWWILDTAHLLLAHYPEAGRYLDDALTPRGASRSRRLRPVPVTPAPWPTAASGCRAHLDLRIPLQSPDEPTATIHPTIKAGTGTDGVLHIPVTRASAH